MNVVDKRNLILFVVRPLGSLILGFLGFIHPTLILISLIFFLISSKIGENIYCPNCGEKIGMQKHRWKTGKVRITYSPTFLTPKKCVYCNFVLKE